VTDRRSGRRTNRYFIVFLFVYLLIPLLVLAGTARGRQSEGSAGFPLVVSDNGLPDRCLNQAHPLTYPADFALTRKPSTLWIHLEAILVDFQRLNPRF
jgi:hypothetical protein